MSLQVILLIAATVLFVGVFIANRVLLRRMKGHAKQNAFTNQAMQQALKNSQNNVLIWHIKEKYTTQLYGQILPCDTITDAEWKAQVHPDDLQEALRNLHDLADGKVKSAEFYYRWNYEFDDKKPPRWGYFNNTSVAEYLPGSDKPVSVISTFTDESELREAQREEQMLADKFKLIFEKSIIGEGTNIYGKIYNSVIGCNITISDEREQLLETGGGLKKAFAGIDEQEPVLACNADILSNIDLRRLIQTYQATGLSQLVVSERDTQRYLCFDTHSTLCGWVNIKTGETKGSDGRHLAFSGMQILNPQTMKRLQQTQAQVFSLTDFYLQTAAQKNAGEQLIAYIPNNYRMMDVGKAEHLHEAELFANSLVESKGLL